MECDDGAADRRLPRLDRPARECVDELPLEAPADAILAGYRKTQLPGDLEVTPQHARRNDGRPERQQRARSECVEWKRRHAHPPRRIPCVPSCLVSPRWMHGVFSVDGREYQWLDIFLAAMLRGEWRAFETRLVEGLACLAEAAEKQYWPDAGRIDAAASAFRYDRDLLTSDATIAWLEQEDLTLDDWTNFLVGRLLVEEWRDRLAPLVDRHALSLTVTDGAFAAEGICSGVFDALASTLA